MRKDCFKRYNNPGGLDHEDSGGDGESGETDNKCAELVRTMKERKQ